MADDSSEIVKEVVEGGTATNAKVLMDGPAFYQNMAFKQAVEASVGWTSINQAIVGKVAESIIATSPAEGGSDLVTLMTLLKGQYMQPPVGFSASQPAAGG
jgi:hypothetical protein